MKTIKISLTKGLFATVDEDDIERIMAHKWRATIRKTVTCAGRGWREGERQRHQYLHRFIVNAPRCVFAQ